MRQDHETFQVKMAFTNFNTNCYLRVDCTDLRCRLCESERFPKIDSIIEHLTIAHQVKFSLEAGLALLPNKYEHERQILCAICDVNQPGFRQLSNHISTHYQTFICESCGKSFMTKPGLQLHMRNTHTDRTHRCVKCRRAFDSVKARRDHVVASRNCWVHRCKLCTERFLTWKLKQSHLVAVHSKPQKTYPCTECGDVFPSQISYYHHFKKNHSSDSFVCAYCGQRYPSKLRLEDHIVTHTKEKRFQCAKCEKSYPRMRGLRRHMHSHHER